MAQVSIVQNVVGGWSISDIRVANMSDTVNMYVESQGTGASATSILRSISGTELYSKICDKKCRGIYEASRGHDGFPVLFAVFGTDLYIIHDAENYTKIYSSLTNYSTPVSMCETGGSIEAHPHLIIVDGANVIAVDTTLTDQDMMTDIRTIQLPYRQSQDDPEHPSQRIVPTHCAYTYNYLIVNDEGTDAFYTSYQYPFEREGKNHEPIDYDIFMVEPWRETEIGYKDYGFITYAEWSPDRISALVSNGTLLYTFGPKSSQIFSYNADVDAPFTSPSNSANLIGIKAPRSLAIVGDYVFYLGSSAIGENGIYYWQGNKLTRCSTPDVERYIQNMEYPQDAVGQCWQENGHLFYSLTFINDDYTLCYDITENLWHRRSSKDPNTNAHHYWRPMFGLLYNGKLIFGTEDGCLVNMNNNKFDEYDGRPMIRMRRSGALMNNYSDFIVDGLKLICNVGDFNNANLVPQIMMRYTDNGGYWSNQEIGLLGRQGEYGTTVMWYNLGIHNIMTVEISCSDPVKFSITGGKIQYSLVDSFQ